MLPFGRHTDTGISHVFWALNFWVLYIISDKLFAFVFATERLPIFTILPTITPWVTYAIVLIGMSPCLVKAWRNPQPHMIFRWVAYAFSCGFLFGWQVHEKASLHFLLPLAAAAVETIEDARHYFILSIEKVFNLDLYFKKTVKYVGEPLTPLESIASSAVLAAIKVNASAIICFTSSVRAARLIAKYRPTMPVLSVVIPRSFSESKKYSTVEDPHSKRASFSLILKDLKFPNQRTKNTKHDTRLTLWFSALDW